MDKDINDLQPTPMSGADDLKEFDKMLEELAKDNPPPPEKKAEAPAQTPLEPPVRKKPNQLGVKKPIKVGPIKSDLPVQRYIAQKVLAAQKLLLDRRYFKRLTLIGRFKLWWKNV